MNIINLIFFLIISAIVIISALGVIISKSIINSAISLIATFLSIAGIFILLNADFVAVSQIIIYGVGITIVMIFAIMLTSQQANEKLWIAKAPRTLFALLITFFLFLTVSYSIFTSKFNIKPPSPQVVETIKKEGTTGIIGQALFTKYVLPFEVLSLLLLATILGAVVVAKKDKDILVNPTTKLED